MVSKLFLGRWKDEKLPINIQITWRLRCQEKAGHLQYCFRILHATTVTTTKDRSNIQNMVVSSRMNSDCLHLFALQKINYRFTSITSIPWGNYILLTSKEMYPQLLQHPTTWTTKAQRREWWTMPIMWRSEWISMGPNLSLLWFKNRRNWTFPMLHTW